MIEEATDQASRTKDKAEVGLGIGFGVLGGCMDNDSFTQSASGVVN